MSGRINVDIALFGAFRKYSEAGSIRLDVAKGTSVSDIKKQLALTISKNHLTFSDSGLIDKSVLADEREVLAENAVIDCNTSLAILPPVCGG